MGVVGDEVPAGEQIARHALASSVSSGNCRPSRIETPAREGMPTEIATLKADAGPDVIAWGGGRFAGTGCGRPDRPIPTRGQPLVLVREGPVDQVEHSRHLNLVEALSFPSGTVVPSGPQHT
jgi:hypothetical protein